MYDITVEDDHGVDIVGIDYADNAITIIQDARRRGMTVTYTGDPFADFDAMNREQNPEDFN